MASSDDGQYMRCVVVCITTIPLSLDTDGLVQLALAKGTGIGSTRNVTAFGPTAPVLGLQELFDNGQLAWLSAAQSTKKVPPSLVLFVTR